LKVLVTGATGFVGSYLVPALAENHELYCLVRHPGEYAVADGVNLIRADLKDPAFVDALPPRVDVIVHLAQASLAAPEHANELFQVNAVSTQRLADYARTVDVSRFVFTSSGNVYRKSATPFLETSQRGSPDFYALTKNFSEDLLQVYGDAFNLSVLRIFVPYGPGQTNRMIPNLITLVRRGRPVTLCNGGQPRINPIYIDDLVQVMVRCLTLPGSYTVNVAGPATIDVKGIALEAGRTLGREPVFEHRDSLDIENLVANTDKLAQLFGMESMVDPVEGIARTVMAHRSKPLG
jgi:nucleoside-diphosphate-sugar epimerase